jgi:hypothetical protein
VLCRGEDSLKSDRSEVYSDPAPAGSLSHKGSWLYQHPAAERTTRSFPLSRKKYGELRQNPYAHEQAAILQEPLDRFLRGRDFIKGHEENRCCVLSTAFEVIEMTPFKTEETLHEYLRRYLDRLSKSKARGLVEQKDVPERDLVTGFPELMTALKK